jgi:predicted nucleic-acid-binding protein
MRAIDTNVLVRLITRDDAGEAAATEDFIEQGAWVSVVVLADAMWRLARFYKLSPEDLAKAIDMLLHHRDLVIQDAEAVASALELFRAKPALGFSDCLILQLARKTGHLPLGTFDRRLAKVEGAQEIQPAPPTSPPSTPPAHSPRRQS